MPDPRAGGRNMLEVASALHAVRQGLNDLTRLTPSCLLILLFDQQPIFFAIVPRLIPPRLHAHHGRGAVELLPSRPNRRPPVTKGVVRIALRPPDTAVADQPRPRTVLLGRDDAF